MARVTKSKLKIIRRLQVLIPGLTAKKISKKKKDNPGQHSKFVAVNTDIAFNFKRKLLEKQKFKFNFVLSETSLRNYIRKAYLKSQFSLSSGTVISNLLDLLKLRLDFVVFSLDIVSTILAARQLIQHGYIKVNNQIIIRSDFPCKKGDIISTQSFLVLSNLFSYSKLYKNKGLGRYDVVLKPQVSSYLKCSIIDNKTMIGRILAKPSEVEYLNPVTSLIRDHESAFLKKKSRKNIKLKNLKSKKDLKSTLKSNKNLKPNLDPILNIEEEENQELINVEKEFQLKKKVFEEIIATTQVLSVIRLYRMKLSIAEKAFINVKKFIEESYKQRILDYNNLISESVVNTCDEKNFISKVKNNYSMHYNSSFGLLDALEFYPSV